VAEAHKDKSDYRDEWVMCSRGGRASQTRSCVFGETLRVEIAMISVSSWRCSVPAYWKVYIQALPMLQKTRVDEGDREVLH